MFAKNSKIKITQIEFRIIFAQSQPRVNSHFKRQLLLYLFYFFGIGKLYFKREIFICETYRTR